MPLPGCCRSDSLKHRKPNGKRTSIVVAGRLAVLGDSRMDEQDNRVGFRFLPLFRRFADEFVIEPYIGLAFLDSCLCRP